MNEYVGEEWRKGRRIRVDGGRGRTGVAGHIPTHAPFYFPKPVV